jgi:flagellar motor switch protein FliN/FliY
MADEPLSQDAIEALLAAESAAAEPEAVAEPEPAAKPRKRAKAADADAAEPVEAAADGPLSQDAIEALLAAEAAADPVLAADEPAGDGPLSQEDIEALLAAEPVPMNPDLPPAFDAPLPLVEDIALDELHPIEAPLDDHAQIELLLDVPLAITVELGQATVTIRDLLELGQGSILPLDRRAGEPVDVLVNGQRLARGEVVVIDEDFGIRVTDVVSRSDRLRSMGE